jgi:hypothetical protein
MDACKLRMKLGPNEFEAEGPQDYVEKQREIFLAKVEANRTLDLKPEKANPEEQRAQQKLDLGNGNTVVAPSTNLHATWKI